MYFLCRLIHNVFVLSVKIRVVCLKEKLSCKEFLKLIQLYFINNADVITLKLIYL